MSRQIVEVRAGDVKMAAVVRDALRDNLDTIAKVTEKYPVEFALGGFRFVFVARAEIEDVIERLDAALAGLAA
jgi:hypothetical protein